tara:strand:+ start:590 stop:781 length:192 start_codon:yes stop_codon:yes gene_type:complete
MKINDRVKVIDQDITGIIVRDYGNKVIIKDDDAEMWIDEFDEGTLEFRKSELEIIERTNNDNR